MEKRKVEVVSAVAPNLSRRKVLKQAALAGVGFAASAGRGFSLPGSWFAAEEEVVPFTDIPADFSTRSGDTVFRLDLRELRSWITPAEDFFSVQHYNRPEIDASGWGLRITGLVDQPMRFRLDDLKSRPRLERTVTFECSGNQGIRHHGMVGNATWAGVSLASLLEAARPSEDAIEVVFWAADKGKEKIRDNEYEQRFARTLSVADAKSSGAILAYQMNGQPLSVRNGFPLRLIVPGWYGIANVKWLERIELSDRRLMNRFMGRDYVTIFGRETESGVEWFERSVTRQRVKSVIARVTRAGDTFKIFGVAWTDGTPLRSVEVQIDGSSWQAASLEDRKNPYAWTFWTLETRGLAAGEHAVVSRATDVKGRAQPESLPLKKTYWEDNGQFKRTILVS